MGTMSAGACVNAALLAEKTFKALPPQQLDNLLEALTLLLCYRATNCRPADIEQKDMEQLTRIYDIFTPEQQEMLMQAVTTILVNRAMDQQPSPITTGSAGAEKEWKPGAMLEAAIKARHVNAKLERAGAVLKLFRTEYIDIGPAETARRAAVTGAARATVADVLENLLTEATAAAAEIPSLIKAAKDTM